MPRWFFAAFFASLAGALAVAVPPTPQGDKKPVPVTEAATAAKRVQAEKGITVELWASEPLMMNPVSFAFDSQGKCFVAETTRFDKGVPDTRGHMEWLDEDIGSRSVADRLAMYQKHHYTGFTEYTDQVRQVWDSTGAGRADKSTVFAAGFNQLKDGLGAGVLARKGSVYYACIPDLYKLTDTTGKGVADKKESLSSGYGIRAQFLGHDLHGLRMGPDGKLYFSIGDRGLNVTTKEGKQLAVLDSGCVLRCAPDGANLEVVHTGLRNPQELAFDDFGNLFTYDNNSDSGDKARWVHVVEGGDSGWRCGYQYGTLMHHVGVDQGNRGPWNTEKIWHLPAEGSGPPAYVVPPLAHFGNGPAGITAYPGVGLGERYNGHFFATDFTASASNSNVWSLGVKPKGASFEVTDLHPFVKSVIPTDCEFGPDGAFYVLDWAGAWSPPNKGRIFKLTDPVAMKNPAIAEAKKLLAEGFEKRPAEELAKLLAHPHRQVRYEAQYELAGRVLAITDRRPAQGGETFDKALGAAKDNTAETAVQALIGVAKFSNDKRARLHAVWAFSQIGRVDLLAKTVGDADVDIRGAVAKGMRPQYPEKTVSMGAGMGESEDDAKDRTYQMTTITRLLADPEPRVRAAAAVVYGVLIGTKFQVKFITPAGPTHKLAPLFDILAANNDQDAYLRQAAVEGLVRSDYGPEGMFNAWKLGGSKYDTPAVRLGVVLALRKLHGPKLAHFLADADPRIVAEAARAIYDEGVTQAMTDLAKLADTPKLPDAVAYRAVAANFKLGTADCAMRVARVAARPGEADYIRDTALKLLADWAKPGRLDPITGLRQDIPARPGDIAAAAVRPVLADLFVGSEGVRKQAATVTAKLGVKEVGPLMNQIVRDAKQPVGVRVEALFALEAVKAGELSDAAKVALASPEAKLRAAARVVNAKADPTAALTELPALVADPTASVIEKQMALGVMGTLPESQAVDAGLVTLMDQALAGKLPPELKLEVLEAANARSASKGLKLHAPVRAKIKAIDTADRAAVDKDPLARYRDTIAGGDAERGRAVFLNSAAVYCQRCHKLDGQGGDVGPAMNGVGSKHPRDYLLESIVNPNAKIAEGYQSVILQTADGRTITGVLRGKDAQNYTVVTADNKVVVVPAADVDGQKPDKSAMPDDLHKKLTRRDLRDVVEFLAGLKDAEKK